MSEKKFIKGLWFNLPHEKAPDFVKGSISISKDNFLEWLDAQETNEKGYIKIDLKVSRNGKAYAELNTYRPGQQEQSPQQNTQPEPSNQEEVNISDIPF